MSGQRHATMVAAATLALTLTPLIGVFEGLGWTVPVLLTITVIATCASLVRAAGRGQGLQTVAMCAGLLIVLTAGFGDGTAFLLIIPLPATFAHFGLLAGEGVAGIVANAPPVAAEGGILFLTLLGIGLVAILHDMFVVGLRTPALAGLTLLTMYLVPVSVAPDATAWFWFILPAVSYLWLLADDNLRRVSAFGHRFTGTGQLVSQRFPSPLARTARWSALGFIVVTLVSLTVVPTNTSGFIDRIAEGYEGGSDAGLGDVNPWAQLSGSLNRPEEVDVLRVSTDDPNPAYLRMHVLDELTSDGFGPNEYDDGEPLSSLADNGSGNPETYTAQIENLALEAPVVPYYGRPVALEIPGGWVVDDETGVINGDGSDMGDVDSYRFDYIDPEPNAETLANAGGMDPGDERWDANTSHPDVPELTEIVERELGGASTVHEKVLAALDYLSVGNGFRYSLQTTDAGNDEAILDFLDAKEGYCQQYAAAMAWMLRESDVAARVVIGLSRGQRDGDEWLLTSHDYHAWVEVYYDGPGWVTYDPTPASGVPGSVSIPWATEPAPDDEETSDPAETEGPSGTTSEAPSAAEEEPSESAETPSDGLTAQAGAEGSGGGFHFNPAWLLLLLFAVLPFVPAVWRGLLRRSRLSPGRVSAATAWDEVLDLALDYGVGLTDSLTPRQAAGVLGQAAPGAREAATALGAAMARHRYSPREADPTGLADAVRDLHAELDKNAEPRRRYRAMLWPASLLAKITAKQAEESARLARRSARATDRVRSAVRRPRRSNSRKNRSVTGRP